jgi:hypothetical protein
MTTHRVPVHLGLQSNPRRQGFIFLLGTSLSREHMR